jgi:hypothetical protein
VALIANRLGVDRATFKAWTARLDAVRNFEEPPPSNAEIMRKPLVEREHGLRRELTTTPRASQEGYCSRSSVRSALRYKSAGLLQRTRVVRPEPYHLGQAQLHAGASHIK